MILLTGHCCLKTAGVARSVAYGLVSGPKHIGGFLRIPANIATRCVRYLPVLACIENKLGNELRLDVDGATSEKLMGSVGFTSALIIASSTFNETSSLEGSASISRSVRINSWQIAPKSIPTHARQSRFGRRLDGRPVYLPAFFRRPTLWESLNALLVVFILKEMICPRVARHFFLFV